MRKPSTRKITTPATAKPAATVKPVIAADTAKPATEATAKPAAAVVPAVPAVAKPSANLTRTAATVARGVTHFAVLSDRDAAYLAFYARLAKQSVLGYVTVAGIAHSGERPGYAGSNKPHDAGVIVRLRKAGLLATDANGSGFTFTDLGKSHAAYTSARA